MWALIADTPYHLYPAYGWVMFVAVFLWLVTIVFFILYLFQLHMKMYMVPWPLVVSLGGSMALGGGGWGVCASRLSHLPLCAAVTEAPSLPEMWLVGVGPQPAVELSGGGRIHGHKYRRTIDLAFFREGRSEACSLSLSFF